MRWLPRRWGLGHAMGAIAALAIVFAAVRYLAVEYYPHARRCWHLAAVEEYRGRAYLRSAAAYEGCIRAVPCLPSQHCNNYCITHVSSREIPKDSDKARADEEHRRAAEDHRKAATKCDEMARRYRAAAFRPSRPMPEWIDTFATFEKYRCDQY